MQHPDIYVIMNDKGEIISNRHNVSSQLLFFYDKEEAKRIAKEVRLQEPLMVIDVYEMDKIIIRKKITV